MSITVDRASAESRTTPLTRWPAEALRRRSPAATAASADRRTHGVEGVALRLEVRRSAGRAPPPSAPGRRRRRASSRPRRGPCFGIAAATISATPGLAQSSGVEVGVDDRGSCRRPASACQSAAVTSPTREEYGGRSRLVVCPVAAAMASWVWSSSASQPPARRCARLTWVNVCDADLVALGLHPADQVRPLGDAGADHEERGVHAVARRARRGSRRVHGVGPSSKVRTTCRGGTRRPPRVGSEGSTMGPPRCTAAGTAPSPGAERGACAPSPTWPEVMPATTRRKKRVTSIRTSTAQWARGVRGGRGAEGAVGARRLAGATRAGLAMAGPGLAGGGRRRVGRRGRAVGAGVGEGRVASRGRRGLRVARFGARLAPRLVRLRGRRRARRRGRGVRMGGLGGRRCGARRTRPGRAGRAAPLGSGLRSSPCATRSDPLRRHDLPW